MEEYYGDFVAPGSFLNTSLGLERTTVEQVEELDITHLVRNLLFIFGHTVLSILSFFVFFIVLPFLLIFGIFSNNWHIFGLGLVGCILVPLLAVASFFGICIFWLVALFQSATVAYTITWLLLGLPVILLGGTGGASPVIIIFIYK